MKYYSLGPLAVLVSKSLCLISGGSKLCT